MQSTVPDLAGLAYSAAYGTMLLGMVLMIFRPFFPGLALVSGAWAAHLGAQFVLTGWIPGEWEILALLLAAVCTFGGLATGWWTEKLGIRFTYVTPELLWGGFLGFVIAALLYMPMFVEIIALFIGATVAAYYVQKRPFKDACTHAPMAIYSMMGPRGFQLLMALLICDMLRGMIVRIGFRAIGVH